MKTARKSGFIATPAGATPRKPQSLDASPQASRQAWPNWPRAWTNRAPRRNWPISSNAIGRLKEKSRGIGQHYEVTVTADATGKNAAAITWTKIPVKGSMLTHPGVYCLRSSETTWDAAKLWHTYTMLTDLEAVFRGLKSELGLRPVFHHNQTRTEGHLFITVLAYQLVQAIRHKLKAAGQTLSWSRLREILSVQQRVTATFRQRDGRTLHVRKATIAEPALHAIYYALAINAAPGEIKKLIA
jgi:hypothetical protein